MVPTLLNLRELVKKILYQVVYDAPDVTRQQTNLQLRSIHMGSNGLTTVSLHERWNF